MRIIWPAAALMCAASAAAQIRDPSAGRNVPLPAPALPGVARELGQTDRIIRDARREGQLSRGEARALGRESRRIAMLEERYMRGGLSEAERAELSNRIAALRSLIGARRR